MGLNISIFEQADDDYPVGNRVDWWDVTRYVGDTEFARALDWEYLRESDGNDVGQRPADFAAARAWVKDSVPLANQPRLLDALERMDSNPRLWMDMGW